MHAELQRRVQVPYRGASALLAAAVALGPGCSLIGARAPATSALDQGADRSVERCSSSRWPPALDLVGLGVSATALGAGISGEDAMPTAAGAGASAIFVASAVYGFHAAKACEDARTAASARARARGRERARARAGSGAGQSAAAGESAAAAADEQRGLPVLRVGTSGDYAPFSRGGAGFDVEVAQRMAADLGYRVEWVPFTWPELRERVASNAFDVGMSGITWRAERSVVGHMSRAVAVGGPCVLSRKPPGMVAVNRGGILEQWARQRFTAEQLRVVEDNLALPRLLEQGEVDAIVTDSFELAHFARPGWSAQCEPARDRKVYWVSQARAPELGPRIDAWLAANEPQLRALRVRWFGRDASWTPVDHLVDLLARRLALMPAVAAYKRARGLPIEDPAREAIVLQQSVDEAARVGLAPESVRALFGEQIAFAKAVQQRAGAGAAEIDLDTVLRPALSRLGEQILSALAACADDLPRLRLEQLDLLADVLEPRERQRLLDALRTVRRAGTSARRGLPTQAIDRVHAAR